MTGDQLSARDRNSIAPLAGVGASSREKETMNEECACLLAGCSRDRAGHCCGDDHSCRCTGDHRRVAIHNTSPFGGDPGGLCFDVLQAIAEREGLELQYQPMGIGDILPALIADAADLGCSGNGPTASLRRDGYAFTGAIASNREVLLVRASDTSTYAALSDLRGL